jgi:phosphoribosylformylglycinamidine (FGAM) synthase-like amidotransferase family enzyme
VDDSNAATEEYPYNPNGSPQGIAGLCSEDGRHLAMMPHPERCFTTWQVRASYIASIVYEYIAMHHFTVMPPPEMDVS